MKNAVLLLALIPTVAICEEECAKMHVVPDKEMSLQEVVNIGLCRNPQTSAAYSALQSSRFTKNAGYANYLPSVSASLSFDKKYTNKQWKDKSYGASLSASYLIFDFGKRLSDMNQMIATYQAAGFEYSDTIQSFIYSVIGAYYELLTADANVDAAESALKVSQTAYDTASKKFKAGAVAKADVLKADTNLAASKLSLERAQNDREISKGTLLTKLSFPADQTIRITDMPSSFGTEAESENIDELIKIAREKRPDLLKATSNTESAWHKRNSAFLKNLPSISATGSVSWKDTRAEALFDSSSKVEGTIGIRASMPIFAGFANMYGVRSAEADYERAQYTEQETINNAMMDVFTAYQNYKTAQKVLSQTEVLLKSAKETERVTSGMYKVGKSTMLDWLTAQSSLVEARKENNAAKYDLFIKRAAVALAIGDIQSGLEEERENEQNKE